MSSWINTRHAALLLLCAVCQAQEPERHATLSPNGHYRVIEKNVDGQIQLWLHDTQQQISRALVTLPGNNQFAVWSPDSLFIAFCATFKSRHFMTVTDLTGHSWLIAEINGECSAPAWSADAVWLAFSAQTKYGDDDIYQATAGGTAHNNISDSRNANETDPYWNNTTGRFQFHQRKAEPQ